MTQQTRADHIAPIASAVALLRGSTEDVLRGISVIDASADRHDPQALEHKAVFEAMGCARSPNWERALDCLAEAAECGSDHARRQLMILARFPAGESGDWAGMRNAITVEKLVESPARLPLSESPRLRVIEGFASVEECNWLIERARDGLHRATVVTHAGRMTVEAARTNSGFEFMLADMDLVIEAIRLRTGAAMRLPLRLFEPVQVLHYAPGEEFKPHHDFFDPKLPGHAEQIREHGQRIATFLVYLNDDYTGGETAFPNAQIGYRGKTGAALFIANVDRNGEPDPATLHSGTPPATGEKWILSQWIRDKAPSAPTVGTDLRSVAQL